MTNALTIESGNNDDALRMAWTELVDNGMRAIQELERILFFTDLPEDPKPRESRQESATKGLHAIHDLERLLWAASSNNNKENREPLTTISEEESPTSSPLKAFGKSSPKQKNKNGNHQSSSYSSSSSFWKSMTSSPTSVTTSNSLNTDVPTTTTSAHHHHHHQLTPSMATLNMLELLKEHFQVALTYGQTVWNEVEVTAKEAERVLLLTDLDEEKLAREFPAGTGGGALMVTTQDVRDEVGWVVQEMEVVLNRFAETAGKPVLEKTQQLWKEMEQQGNYALKDAYTECERVLFFTDLDENKLVAEHRTNNDVITHFISSQKVHEEMTVAVSRAWSFPFQYSMVRSQTVDTYSSCQKLPPTREEEEEAQVTKAIEMYLDR